MRCKNCIWFFISYVLEYYCKRYKRYKCSVSLLRRIVLTVENYVTEKNVRIYQCLFAKHVVHNNWQYLNTRAARAYTEGGRITRTSVCPNAYLGPTSVHRKSSGLPSKIRRRTFHRGCWPQRRRRVRPESSRSSHRLDTSTSSHSIAGQDMRGNTADIECRETQSSYN